MISEAETKRAKSRITREDLRDQLEVMKKRVIDPKVGLYGPDSMVWEVSKHSTVFFGAGRANLLQLAHPWVTHAVDQHSAVHTDPLGRFRRTFINVYSMVFGSLDQVLDSAFRVHQIHDGIRGKLTERTGAYAQGSGYIANHAGSMIWVHATLWETAAKMYEMFRRPLRPDEKERYYEETKLFAFCFGIPEEMLPPTWNEFIEYNEKMWDSEQLVVGEVGRKLANDLFRMGGPLSSALRRHRLHTAMLLPNRLREEFGLPERTDANWRAYERDVRLAKRLMPAMPPHVRYIPPYLEAKARIAGKKSPDVITRAATRAMLGVPRLVA